MYFTVGERSMSACNPGRKKTGSLYMNFSSVCLICLSLLLTLLCALEYHWLWALWVFPGIFQIRGLSWDSWHKSQKSKQAKQMKNRTKTTNITCKRKEGFNKTEPYFSGLSGNLIRNSWFLYDLFSNVRIIFFTELSSSGSSWHKGNK